MIVRLRAAIMWFVVLISLVASSCSHHDLTYGPTRRSAVVNVEFDWSDDPAASPAEMTVYFFRTDASRNAAPIAYD
ncbi:MAG: DUF5119 domain-containing protein, partial [Muribaculaceae bacterium]|nr:DUF5119 domain-containing protein [Muribaculaceae bacterium]